MNIRRASKGSSLTWSPSAGFTGRLQRNAHSVFSGLVQDLDARKALEAFTLSGPYGHLLDAVETGFTANPVQAFEMERFMKDTTARDIVVPVLTYLFHRLERHFDGRPPSPP